MLDKNLWQQAKNERILLAVLMTISFVSGLLAILQAIYLTDIINGVFLNGLGLQEVKPWLGWLLVTMAARSAAIYLTGKFGQCFAVKIKNSVRGRLIEHIFALGPVAIRSQQAGQLITILTDGVENLEAYFAKYLPQLAAAVIIPITILIAVIPLDAIAAAVLVITAPLIPVFMFLIGSYAEKLNKRQWTALLRMGGHLLDVLQGISVLKIFGRSQAQLRVIARISEQFRSSTMEVLRIAFLSALVLELLATISTAVIAVMVGLRLLTADLTFTQAFFLLLLAPELYLPLRLLGTHFHAGMSGATAAVDIYKLLDTSAGYAATGDKQITHSGKIAIAFEAVHYSYQHDTRPALQGVSFVVQPGQKIALVGPSGSGKSTILNLLLGYISPDSGVIRINGVPLTELNLSDWLVHVAYVPQFPHLFYGTVADNIRLHAGEAPLTAVMEAAQKAGAHDFIMDLPLGYDTLIGEGGRPLSGGESQRLAIARALLKDAPVVLFDEATAQLDLATEAAIQTALKQLLINRTALIIAHRLGTVYQADHIVVLDQGRIAETGRHSELIAQGGVYQQLVSAYGGAK